MSIKALACPHCTAPLPPEATKSVICTYCGRVLVGLPRTWWARPVRVPPWEGRLSDRGKPRVGLGRHRYVLGAKLGSGENCDVYRAHRDARLSERVVLKVATDRPGEPKSQRLRKAWRILGRLRSSTAQGAAHFARLLPVPVAHGQLRADGRADRLATAFQWRPGFRHTAADVRKRYTRGVDPRAAVWLWKRMLEMLTWVHASGFVHGNLRPEHVLVHPRDHGAVFCGWSHARWRHGSSATTDRPAPASDVMQSAAVVAHVLGGTPRKLPSRVPDALGRLVLDQASARHAKDDAWTLRTELVDLSERLFGPPRHMPLDLDE